MTCSMLETGVAGIHRDAGLLAERADRLQRAMHVRARLNMHRDDVGAGFGEGLEIGIARCDHEMHVEGLFGEGTKGLHHCWADGNIGHKMAVHHVDVDPIGAGGLNRAYFFA